MESGTLYVMSNEWIRDPKTNNMPYKIGITKNTVDDRYYGLGLKMPGKFETLFAYELENYENAEKIIHKIFDKKRINGEWFELNKQELDLIKANCEEMNGILITEEINDIINEEINLNNDNILMEDLLNNIKCIPDNIKKEILNEFKDELPYIERRIEINETLIIITIEILNSSKDRELPQNCRQVKKENKPFGLDKMINIRLNDDLRRANIISDELQKKNIVEVFRKIDPKNNREKNYTRLINYTW